jgi:hypothetical protein
LIETHRNFSGAKGGKWFLSHLPPLSAGDGPFQTFMELPMRPSLQLSVLLSLFLLAGGAAQASPIATKGAAPTTLAPKPKTSGASASVSSPVAATQAAPNYALAAADLDQASAGLGQITVNGPGAQQDVVTAKLDVGKARSLVTSLAAAAHVTLGASNATGAGATLTQIQQTLESAQALLQQGQTSGSPADLSLAIGKVQAALIGVKDAIAAN